MAKLMENIQSSKKMEGNLEKLSLKGYYQSLPERIAPKQKMLEEIQEECDRLTSVKPTMTTIRNWVLYGLRPQNPMHVQAIVNVTGIAEEDLWQD
jgi:hypothetical protein